MILLRKIIFNKVLYGLLFPWALEYKLTISSCVSRKILAQVAEKKSKAIIQRMH
jgi:hypothetical protein